MIRWPLISLYAPGDRPDLIAKVSRFGPDAVIIDLEDSVPKAKKRETRRSLAEIVPNVSVPVLVRINNEPELLEDDLDAVITSNLYGIVLPKVDSAEQVRHVDGIISYLERSRGIEKNAIKLLLQIETALGVYNCYSSAVASERVESVIFGSAEDGDLQRDLRASFSIEGFELMYARSKTLLDARAASLPYVLDGAFSDIKNEEALRIDCRISRRLGYDGRTLIHPHHISIAREVYRAAPGEVAYYQRLVTAFESAVGEGKSAINFEGKLVDYAMYKQALRFLGRAGNG